MSWPAIPAVAVLGVLLAGCSSGPAAATPPTTAASHSATVDQLLATGIAQARAHDFSEAKTTFKDVLSLDAGNSYAWYNLGLIAQTESDPKGAVSDYQRAIKTNPADTSAMYNEAIALEPTDRQQALSLYKRIVALNPKASTAYLRLSFLYDEMGDHKDAVAAREKAAALNSKLSSVPPPTT